MFPCPYRCEGKGGPGEVTSRDLVEEMFNEAGRRQSVTVIASTNMELLEFAMNYVLRSYEDEEGGEEGGDRENKKARKNNESSTLIKIENSVRGGIGTEVNENKPKLPALKIQLYGKV
jgi:hypothetical protein